jgi:2-keto-3-deoxy-L-rhamnonate aldolase RhmA
MSIKLMYITNDPKIAGIAQTAGTDRIFIDLEVLGKFERQGFIDSVKSHHSVDDIVSVKKVMNRSELLVRVNPVHGGSGEEINQVIANGAEILMLPMFKTVSEVEEFIRLVGGRAKVCLLLETREADEALDDILRLGGVDEVLIGLNDLHLSYHKHFMFELLSDGTVERICNKLRQKNMFYGFGGIARIGYGMLPAENILAEHYRLGSQMVILSRSFCDAHELKKLDLIKDRFIHGISAIRRYEDRYAGWTANQFSANEIIVRDYVEKIVSTMKAKAQA